jgi:hypothetical protein
MVFLLAFQAERQSSQNPDHPLLVNNTSPKSPFVRRTIYITRIDSRLPERVVVSKSGGVTVAWGQR